MSRADRSPGWVLDVVLAAAAAAGLQVHGATVHLHDAATTRQVLVHLARKDVTAGMALLSVLGAVARVSEPYGGPERPQADVEGQAAVLGEVEVCCIATEGLPAGDDPATLSAAVDAARAEAPHPAAVIAGQNTPATTGKEDR